MSVPKFGALTFALDRISLISDEIFPARALRESVQQAADLRDEVGCCKGRLPADKGNFPANSLETGKSKHEHTYDLTAPCTIYVCGLSRHLLGVERGAELRLSWSAPTGGGVSTAAAGRFSRECLSHVEIFGTESDRSSRQSKVKVAVQHGGHCDRKLAQEIWTLIQKQPKRELANVRVISLANSD